jgi:hypothetical protein
MNLRPKDLSGIHLWSKPACKMSNIEFLDMFKHEWKFVLLISAN